jgi:hypothetical protein
LAVEVSNVSPDGFWLLVDERELFVAFADFPRFRDATIREITSVERAGPHHLRWPELDVDLALASIEHPERFPLLSRQPPRRAVSRARRRVPPKPR